MNLLVAFWPGPREFRVMQCEAPRGPHRLMTTSGPFIRRWRWAGASFVAEGELLALDRGNVGHVVIIVQMHLRAR